MSWLDRLKEMKVQSGLTTKQIAVASGLPEPTLIKLFSGVTKDPKLTTIQQLVHFFGHTLDDLVDSQNTDSGSSVHLSDDEEVLLVNYRKLSNNGKSYIQQQMTIALTMFNQKSNASPDVEEA